MSAKVYDVTVEVFTTPDPNAKSYDAYVELGHAQDPNAKSYDAYVELGHTQDPNAKSYDVYVEFIAQTTYKAYVDGVGANGVIGVLPMAAGRVGLRWSDDGGHTWSDYYERSLGDTGEYGTRVRWQRLGMTMKLRDRVYELSGTDATKITIMGAELQIQPTNA